MIKKTFNWDYLKKSPDTSGSDPDYSRLFFEVGLQDAGTDGVFGVDKVT